MNANVEKDTVFTNSTENPYGKIRGREKRSGKMFYETVIMLRSDIASQDARDLVKKIVSIVEERSGKCEKVEYWGLRRLSYKIKKNNKSHYYCISFEGSSEVVNELDRVLKINNAVLRFLTLRLRFIDMEKSPMIVNLPKDIENDKVVYDEKYQYSNN